MCQDWALAWQLGEFGPYFILIMGYAFYFVKLWSHKFLFDISISPSKLGFNFGKSYSPKQIMGGFPDYYLLINDRIKDIEYGLVKL
jgi:hypothetical protein